MSYVSGLGTMHRLRHRTHQEAQLKLAVISDDQGVAGLANECTADSIAILLQRGLVLQIWPARRKPPGLGVDVQRTVHALLRPSQVASLRVRHQQRAAQHISKMQTRTMREPVAAG